MSLFIGNKMLVKSVPGLPQIIILVMHVPLSTMKQDGMQEQQIFIRFDFIA